MTRRTAPALSSRVRAVLAAGAAALVVFVAVVLGLVAAANAEYGPYASQPGAWVLVALAAVWIPQTLLAASQVADRRQRHHSAELTRRTPDGPVQPGVVA